MSGFGLNKKKDKPGAVCFAALFAKQLGDKLRTKRKLMAVVNLPMWIKQFEELQAKHSLDDISQVLNWYLANIGKEGVPQAYSAKSFKKYYAQLSARAKQDGVELTTPVLSDEAQKLTKELLQLLWPMGVEAQVPETVESSLANYKAFLAKVKKARDMSTLPKHYGRWIDWLLAANRLQPPVLFVRSWMKMINRTLVNWKEWSGSLETFGFHENHGKFYSMGTAWASEYCNIWQRWEEFNNWMNKNVR